MARQPNASVQTRRLLQSMLPRPDHWRYGYDLSKETGLKSGTLYPLLMRLEQAGWLETRWAEPEAPGRPPRHLYRLTTTGRSEARRLLQSEQEPARATRLTPLPGGQSG